MNEYGILNNRKRAIVALVHSIAFGLLATYQLLSGQNPRALVGAPSGKMAGPMALTIIYLIVSTILLILVRYSRCTLERLYFAFCATSASVGLLRSLFGDPTVYTSSVIRVLMLGCAVVTGTIILRSYSVVVVEFAD